MTDVGALQRADERPDREAALVRNAVAGDVTAIREVLRLVSPDVRAAVARFVGPHSRELEDWVQESLLSFVRALPEFRGESSVSHYAKRIAVLKMIDRKKSLMAQKRAFDLQVGIDADEAPASPRQLGDARAARLRVVFQELLGTLPPEQAEAFALRHLLDYSVVEIGEQSQVSPNTIRSRLRLAKQALLERIQSDPQLSFLLEESR